MKFSRGAAAALLALVLSAPLFAQATGTGGGRARERDTVIVRAFGTGKLDTITTMFRALEHEQYGSPAWLLLTKKLDSLMLSRGGQIMLRMPGLGGPPESMPRGWVGFNAQGPSQRSIDDNGYRVTYFAYPSILSVDPESPADRAGIAPGDILVAMNGIDVVGHEFNLTKMFVPEKKVALTIRRDGETKDYSLDIVKAPDRVFNRRAEFDRVPGPPMAMPPGDMRVEIFKKGEEFPRRSVEGAMMGSRVRAMAGPLMAGGGFMVITPHGLFGADASSVSAELAKVLKLEKGVLVNAVPEKSPAFKAGLRVGDVIVNAAGQAVTSLSELQDVIVSRLGDRTVALQIVRDRKPQKVTVTW